MDDDRDGLARRELGEPDHVDRVVGPELLVVGRIGERQREHALLLEVGFVDPRERAHDDRPSAHIARLHRRVLTRRALAVVLVADGDPLDAGLLVLTRQVGQRLHGSVPRVEAVSVTVGERVRHPGEEVLRDVREVAAVAEPRAGRRDVIGRALPHRLEQHA